MKRRLIQLTGLLALFIALFLLPSFLKAQEPPICLPPGAGITCENCTPNYIVKYSENGTLVNSPFYVNPNNNFIGYNTTNPGVPLQISADNPRIRLEFPNIKTFTFGLNQGIGSGKAFYFADNTNSAVRLKIHDEGSIEGGSFISHWLKLNPGPSEPFACTQNQEGSIYWKQSEGLYCCLNNQWQLCAQGTGGEGGPGGGGPVCGNGICEAGENANNCPQDCVEGGGEASGDVKVNNSDGPISVQAGQSVTVSWNITCTGDYKDSRVEKFVNGEYKGRLSSDDYGTVNNEVPSNNATGTVEYSARCTIHGNAYEVDEATVNVEQPPPEPICYSNAQCNDRIRCTIDVCLNPGQPNAECSNIWDEGIPGCGECPPNRKPCCGDDYCAVEDGENSTNCPADCP